MLNSIGIALTSAVAMGLMVGWSAVTAQADQERPTLGQGVFCDTVDEVQAAVRIPDVDVENVLSKVNDRFGKESCNVLTGVYIEKNISATVLVATGIVNVTRVELVGFRHDGSWMLMKHPMEQYIGVFERATRV
jgi:hypothetical protein